MPRKTRLARPFVFVNVAMTADGKIATANRAVSSFGSPHDARHLMELRAQADAIIAGARTVDSNPITLGPGGAKYRRMRLKRGLPEYNLRVLVSGTGSVNPGAEVFRRKFSPIIVLTTGRCPPSRLARLRAVADEVKICGRERLNFPLALRWLREKWKVKRLLCEGGGELNDGLLRAGLVDELHVTVCPFIFGGRNAPTLSDRRGFGSLAKAARLQLKAAAPRGDELFLVFRRA